MRSGLRKHGWLGRVCALRRGLVCTRSGRGSLHSVRRWHSVRQCRRDGLEPVPGRVRGGGRLGRVHAMPRGLLRALRRLARLPAVPRRSVLRARHGSAGDVPRRIGRRARQRGVRAVPRRLLRGNG